MKPVIPKYIGKFFLLIFLLIFLLPGNIFCQKKYEVQYILSGKDTLYKIQQFDLKTVFETKSLAEIYIAKLPAVILDKGFPASSLDSVFYDSARARVKIFLGEKYKWVKLSTDRIDQNVL